MKGDGEVGHEFNSEAVSAKNVKDFLGLVANNLGKRTTEKFIFEAIDYIGCVKINSPIEQLFYIAFQTLQDLGDTNCRYRPVGDAVLFEGIKITPQAQIGKYRVDFLIEPIFLSEGKSGDTRPRSVVVECDGHEFHEKTEPQRRHEKQRDRFLQKAGYKVFRFTGAELHNNPFAAAIEVYSYVADDPDCYWEDEITDLMG